MSWGVDGGGGVGGYGSAIWRGGGGVGMMAGLFCLLFLGLRFASSSSLLAPF